MEPIIYTVQVFAFLIFSQFNFLEMTYSQLKYRDLQPIKMEQNIEQKVEKMILTKKTQTSKKLVSED